MRQAGRLASIFRAHDLDLLHTNQTGCDESAVAARLAGIPRVLGTFHIDPSNDINGTRGGFRYRSIECLSNHCLTKAIGVSAAASRAWVRRTYLAPNRVVTIHNGINAGQFQRRLDRLAARKELGLPNDDARPILGCVGRLVEAKGIAYLLRAVASLTSAYPDLMLVLAGEGPLRSSLGREAESLGIGKKVVFVGYCQDVSTLYRAIDLFVLPSLSETLGYAFLEAMAAGLAIVGSNVGGIPEVIEHGKTGFLVPPRNSEALALAIRTLLLSPSLRMEFGLAGRERVLRDFREDTMVESTIRVYRELLTPGRTSPSS